MGTLSALLLAENGVNVALWGVSRERVELLRVERENRRYLPGHPFPDNVTPTADASEAFRDAELVVSAVPCQFMRAVWSSLSGAAPVAVPFVSTAKGIEVQTLLTPTRIIAEVIGASRLAALSGPSIAPEVARRLPAAVVAASEDEDVADIVQAAFSTRTFRVYTNLDLIGVEIAAATKNVIALAAGMIDAVGAGDNAKAALLTRGLVEITRLGVAMGAHVDTFRGLAGIGDLVTTCISPVGRNRGAGEHIGRGERTEDVVRESKSIIEGIDTTRAVMELAHQYHVEMPITHAVYTVLFEHQDPAAAIEELMSRQLRAE